MLSSQRGLAALLIPRLPFYYGWVILACVCSAGFARQGPAVATLSIFVEPMTSEFGWSRTALSGAVSLGGILAAVASPLIGPVLDRQGAAADPLHRRARHERYNHAAVADAVAARLLHPVLHRPHELRGHLRPRHLRRAQQLVRRAARLRHGDCQPGDDGGPRRAPLHRAPRHAGGWLARGLARGRGHGADRRFRADLAVHGAATGGRGPGAGSAACNGCRIGDGEASARACRALVHARRGAAYACVLAAVALHDGGVPRAGGHQPAPGAAPDRARPGRGVGRNDRQHVLAGLGDRGVGLRIAGAENWRPSLSRGSGRVAGHQRHPACSA